MEAVLSWIKEFLIIYLILTILMHLVINDQYKKYLRFFSGIILLTALVSPVMKLLGSAGQLESLVSYEAFWEQLDSTRQDTQKMEFLQNDHYVKKYEKAVAQDILERAGRQGYPVIRVSADLTKDYEITDVSIWLEVLKQAEFLVETATDGSIAVEKVKQSKPGYYDLILMDIQMPVMDGYDATRVIREIENPALAGIPIIAVSANTFEEDRRMAIESGMNAHLGKPLEPPKLYKMIEKFFKE